MEFTIWLKTENKEHHNQDSPPLVSKQIHTNFNQSEATDLRLKHTINSKFKTAALPLHSPLYCERKGHDPFVTKLMKEDK